MAARWIEMITGSIEGKRRWRAYRARIDRLPAGYRTAVGGVERYLVYTGPGDGDRLVQMVEDLADLFERGAADGTPVRAIVGDDPVEFVEAFTSNYGLATYVSKEQRRLTDAMVRAAQQEERQ
jgi:DNA-binding ferritin-like protein (Dps family)